MRVAVVGAGPAGLFLGMSLARRGHIVEVIERDSGPDSSAIWPRRGVMQFQLPHFFRPQVRDALLAEVPEVVDNLVAAGALETAISPFMPEFKGFRVRRPVFERVLRAAAVAESGVSFVTGHVQRPTLDGARVTGVVVDGASRPADLVIAASGRTSRFGDAIRPPAIGGDSGFAYVARQYRLRAGAEPGPTNGPPGWAGTYDGYLVIVFPQDARTFQVLIVRRSDDAELARLRDANVFDVAAHAIPSVAAWIDDDRAEAESLPMARAGLHNSYRGQPPAGNGLTGLLFVGDAVLATNPAAGRGVTTSLMQAQRLLEALDEHGRDFTSTSLEFDSWCHEAMKPWFDDHVRWDAGLLSRWRGEPIDFGAPLPSDLICSTAEADPSVMPTVGAYLSMKAGPQVLALIEGKARDVLRAGFRPAIPEGPSRDQLVEIIDRVS